MGAQMAVFAMHGHHGLRLHQLVHLVQIGAVGVARNMVAPAVIIHHIHAHFRQLVHNADHTAFIAGDGFRGKEEQIALFQADALIFAIGQLRTGGAAFALAASDQQHHVFPGQMAHIFG